jgi:hypothetical protein
MLLQVAGDPASRLFIQEISKYQHFLLIVSQNTILKTGL